MFTGIVEEVGTVQSVTRRGNLYELKISAKKVLENTKYGDSICTNGVCLTVTSLGSDYYTAEVMPKSIENTSLGSLVKNSKVNLERALPVNGRLDGHIVQGHIDGVGSILSITKDDFNVQIKISTTSEILKYIVLRGSITIDGISLTVSDVWDLGFEVSIIPTTLLETNLSEKKPGSIVNIETDILGKYVEKMLREKSSGITMEFLAENGF